MKRYFLLFLSTFSLSVALGQSMDSLLVSAPSSVFPLVRHNARLDLLDYYRSDMEAKVQNDLEGTTFLTKLTKDFCAIQLSESATMEIKRLPFHNDSLIAVVHNIQASGASGRVAFYTPLWRLQRIDLPTLQPLQFLKIDSIPINKRENLMRLTSFFTYSYHWNDHRNILMLTPSIERFSISIQDELRPYLHPVSWYWRDNGKFETE